MRYVHVTLAEPAPCVQCAEWIQKGERGILIEFDDDDDDDVSTYCHLACMDNFERNCFVQGG